MKRVAQSVSFILLLAACGSNSATVEPGGNPESIDQSGGEAESELLEMASGAVENGCSSETAYKIGPSSFTVGAGERTTFSARPGSEICLLDAGRACVATANIEASTTNISFALTGDDCNVLTVR